MLRMVLYVLKKEDPCALIGTLAFSVVSAECAVRYDACHILAWLKTGNA